MALFKPKKVTNFVPLDKKRITEELLSRGIEAECVVYDTIPSTNTAAAEYGRKNPGACALFLAEEQSAGSGRLGRRFYSPKGAGLYMTLLFTPDGEESGGVWLTTLTAVAVRRAIKRLAPLNPSIKWVNDLYLDGKKLAGILAKASLDEMGGIKYAIIGIGINILDTPLPDEIKDIATSLEAAGGGRIDRNILAATIAENFFLALGDSRESLIKEYKSTSLVLGKRVRVIKSDEEYYAEATDITERGELVLTLDNGEKEILSTGEVSIKDF